MYPITDCRLTGLSHTQQVSRLIEGGASLIQLREKHRSPSEFYDDASAALALAREHDVLLLINDRVDITLALGADGVHLGQYDMPIPEARVLLGRSAVIGVSTHTVGQAELATSLPIDYLAFGPVFPTASKEDHEPVAGLQQLREQGELCQCELTACCTIAQPTVSHHLKVLREAGIVLGEKRGVWVYYRLNPSALDGLRRYVA